MDFLKFCTVHPSHVINRNVTQHMLLSRRHISVKSHLFIKHAHHINQPTKRKGTQQQSSGNLQRNQQQIGCGNRWLIEASPRMWQVLECDGIAEVSMATFHKAQLAL